MTTELNTDMHTMSDEDFLNAVPTQFPIEEETNVEPEANGFETPPTKTIEEELEAEANEEGLAPEEDEHSEESEEGAEESEEGEEEHEEGEGEETLDIDFEAQYNALLEPFKANGQDMQVQSVEEAVRLMQMGANYNKKMSSLKPNLKLMKMLENNELLNEDKLNLLIDVAKGNPEAISQLVRDNNIDPLNLTTTEENKYTPKQHTVGDNEVELDDVISRIQDSTSFSDTMDIVSSKWDDASKRDIASKPQQLEVINKHVSDGTYAKVSAEVNRIQMFGGLTGLSDFDAYKQVGDQMFKAGKLDLGQTQPNKVVKTAPKAKASEQPRKDKRKAASPTKNTATQKVNPQYDYLNMSEAEFEKLLK